MTAPEELERRSGRASLLAKEGGSASGLLVFAAALLREQGRVATAVLALQARGPFSGEAGEDLPRFASLFGGFLDALAPACPDDLRDEVLSRARAGETGLLEQLTSFWDGGASTGDFLVRAFLRPCLEASSEAGCSLARPSSEGSCPRCGGPPSLAVRRPQEGSEAGERFLFCPLCGFEFRFSRIRCPGCLEESPAALPHFQSDRYPGVRVEACDSCRRYVKSLDLTLDARPVPEIDDLVSVAVDLWAQEQGYARLEPGLAGM